jgi:hypothetical protein
MAGYTNLADENYPCVPRKAVKSLPQPLDTILDSKFDPMTCFAGYKY